MKDKNIQLNLFIKHMNQSDAMAYNMEYVAARTVSEFGILNKTYEGSGKLYAKLKTAIDNNTCESPACEWEVKQLKRFTNLSDLFCCMTTPFNFFFKVILKTQ